MSFGTTPFSKPITCQCAGQIGELDGAASFGAVAGQSGAGNAINRRQARDIREIDKQAISKRDMGDS